MERDTPEQDEDFRQKRKSNAGRRLVRWNPDLDQLLVLCIDYECAKQGITLPWDDIAKLIEPHLSGEAVKQHLVKLYKFREEDAHKVPPKLDRNERRKAQSKLAVATPTAVRGRGKRSSIQGDGAGGVTVTPAKPGSSLLYKKPEPKSKRTPKKDITLPKTPVTGRGRKMTGTPVKLEDDSDEVPIVQYTKPVARSGKRGRKPKNEECEGDSIIESPSKKPKTNNYLREMPSVNYNEQLAQDDEDDDSEEEGITLKSDYQQKRQQSSQDTEGDHSTSPPRFGVASSAVSSLHQSYPIATTEYGYNTNSASLNPSPPESDYGMSNYRYDAGPAQMMQFPGIDTFDQGYDGMHGFQLNNALAISNSAGYGHEAVPAINNFASHQAVIPSNPYATSTAQQSNFDNVYSDNHDNGRLNTSEVDRNAGLYAGGSLGGIHTALDDAITLHNPGSGTFADTTIGAADAHYSPQVINSSPDNFVGGETGITPALVQTGFQPRAPMHTDSFDSGYDGVYKSEEDEQFASGLFDDLNDYDAYHDTVVAANQDFCL